MRKSIAGCPKIRRIAQGLLIATVIFTFAVMNGPLSYAQDTGGPVQPRAPRARRRAAATGQATGRRQYEPLQVVKSDHLGPQNVLNTKADVNFEKNLKDLMGKMHRIEIYKVERLKTPGIRYYARVDGEPRDITYLKLRSGQIALVNVEGTKPEHNLYKHYYSTKGARLTNGEYWTQNRLLAEMALLPGKQLTFSWPQRYVDEHSFTLILADPIHIAALNPAQVFSSSDSGDDLIGLIPIEVWLSCLMSSKNLQSCTEGCASDAPVDAAPSEWGGGGGLGISKGKACRESGCLMCAGICCKPAACTSKTNPEPFGKYNLKVN